MKNQLAILTIALSLSSCGYLSSHYKVSKVAATPAGAAVVTNAADKVIQKGLDAAATKIETGNPYLHSVADAIRSNPDGILDPANIQRIFVNYGDPANKTKFKTLGLDMWKLAKDAAIKFGKENAAELIANGLQQGAENKQPNTP